MQKSSICTIKQLFKHIYIYVCVINGSDGQVRNPLTWLQALQTALASLILHIAVSFQLNHHISDHCVHLLCLSSWSVVVSQSQQLLKQV